MKRWQQVFSAVCRLVFYGGGCNETVFSVFHTLRVGYFPVIPDFLPATALSAVFNVSDVSELENALSEAQANGEHDTINLAAGTYDVSGGIAVYVAKTTAPVENFTLTIVGAGPDQTILDGDNVARVLSIDTSITTEPLGDLAATVTLRGVRLQNGQATNGGGAYIRTGYASVSIENVVLVSNASSNNGGGLYIFVNNTGNVTLSGIHALNNQSAGGGAGTYVYSGGNIDILDSTFENNTVTADNTGGGLYAQSTVTGTVVTVKGCSFIGNEALAADAIAGGSYTETGQNNTTVFINNTLSGNSARQGGGAYFNAGPVVVANNTLSGNHAMIEGGGMVFEMQGGVASIANNIVWGNTAVGLGADIRFWDGVAADVAILSNNDYGVLSSSGGGMITEEANNIRLNPLFVSTADADPANWDLHLRESSPAIDAGDNAHIPAGITTDRDSDNRTIDGNDDGTATVDMGSDEYRPPAPPPSSTPTASGGGGGGCSVHNGTVFDPLMLLMLIVGVCYRIVRSYNSHTS